MKVWVILDWERGEGGDVEIVFDSEDKKEQFLKDNPRGEDWTLTWKVVECELNKRVSD